MIDKVYFITSNNFKKEEAESVFKSSNIDLKIVDLNIVEIMNFDLEIIVRDKTLKAYKEFGLPCAVEHGALHITSLNDLPGGISKVVWDKIKEKICDLIPSNESRLATAKSVVGYCDGKKIYLFTGETNGTIAESARGDRKFQWDPVFIPMGSDKTYSELGLDEKLKYSQAVKAWKGLIDFITTSH